MQESTNIESRQEPVSNSQHDHLHGRGTLVVSYKQHPGDVRRERSLRVDFLNLTYDIFHSIRNGMSPSCSPSRKVYIY
jgi:hypothetical protein